MDFLLVHDFDPALAEIGGVGIYWYGAVYTLGFLGIFAWFAARRRRLGWAAGDPVELTILAAIGVLVGGRALDILVYEMDYYRAHPWQVLDWWQGGMASHGVLLGGLAMVAVFCALREKPLLVVLDEMMVPLAVLLALGRLGNFIEGGVIGSATGGAWGVIYPDVEAPRHPVALYESLKNLAIVPVLMLALRRWPSGRGIVTGLFVVLYAGLRVVVDLLRDYESVWLGLGPGQVMNLAMAGAGLILLVWVALRPPFVPPPVPALPRRAGLARMVLLIALVLYPLGIPTSWTAANITEKRAAGALAGG